MVTAQMQLIITLEDGRIIGAFRTANIEGLHTCYGYEANFDEGGQLEHHLCVGEWVVCRVGVV